ncbi:MAG: toll/interleukin-1 receptor domain-containing protein [Smithella sp.]|jgi:hypothetical protein
MPNEQTASIFLSHNLADKEYVRKLAAAIAVTGAHVWFDEWVIRPGDSIPGAIDQGLTGFTTFALVWSEAASKSRWVKTEMEAAVTRWINDDRIRLIPVLLDKTPLPVLLASIRYIDSAKGNHIGVARELLGIGSETAFRLAVQSFIDEAGLEFREFYGVGVLVACPRCGATPDNLEGWEDFDHQRGDRYVGARCKICGWSDGSEM